MRERAEEPLTCRLEARVSIALEFDGKTSVDLEVTFALRNVRGHGHERERAVNLALQSRMQKQATTNANGNRKALTTGKIHVYPAEMQNLEKTDLSDHFNLDCSLCDAFAASLVEIRPSKTSSDLGAPSRIPRFGD